MLAIISTAYLHHQQLYADCAIHNPHFIRVINAVSEQTGAPVDKILSDDRRSYYMYCRHLVHYSLVKLLKFTPIVVQDTLGVQKSSIYNSIHNINGWKHTVEYVTEDVEQITKALNELDKV